MESDRMIIDVWKDTDQIVEDLPVDRKYKFKSGVNIMLGATTSAVTVSYRMSVAVSEAGIRKRCKRSF